MTERDAESKGKSSETNVKETIESILVAFILAFVFRAFVVEAFVIPTGSMAPTLLGAHMRFKCDDCGYPFDVNFSGTNDGDDVLIPSRANDFLIGRTGQKFNKTFAIYCPNCGYRVQRAGADRNNIATNPPVRYGDRILVLKYLYLFQDPKRWDVVVFKTPDNPGEFDYQINYIKRLIGRPGEVVMVLDGDIYIAKNAKPVKELTPGDFEIQTKPRTVQDALWRVVYDNDYYPQGIASGNVSKAGAIGRASGTETPWKQPWTPQRGEAGWNLGKDSNTGRVFAFDSLTDQASIYFDAAANQFKDKRTRALTDWLAYDVTAQQGPDNDRRTTDHFDEDVYAGDANVSDLRLSFFYQRAGGDGPLRVSLSKIDRTFIAEIAPGKATLYQRVSNGDEKLITSVPIDSDLSKPTRIDFINVDYRVSLRVNDRESFATTPAQYHPDVQALLDAFNDRRPMDRASVRIAAGKQRCTLTHVSLWRDVYYLNRKPGEKGEGKLTWATPADWPNRLMALGRDEYFVCGDNSAISGDGRYWDRRVNLVDEDLRAESGRVPKRFLLGRAFFVYWPAGFRPVDSAPALVPNFGDMRFIH